MGAAGDAVIAEGVVDAGDGEAVGGAAGAVLDAERVHVEHHVAAGGGALRSMKQTQTKLQRTAQVCCGEASNLSLIMCKSFF